MARRPVCSAHSQRYIVEWLPSGELSVCVCISMRFLYSVKIKAPFAQSLGFSASSYAVAASRRWNDLQSLQKSVQYFHSIYHISTACNSSWLKIFSRGWLCPCSIFRIYGRISINMRGSPASCGPYPHANSEALRRFTHASCDYRCRQRYGRHPFERI